MQFSKKSCKIRKKSQEHSKPTFVYKDNCINKNSNKKRSQKAIKTLYNTQIIKTTLIKPNWKPRNAQNWKK